MTTLRREEMIITCETNEEASNVYYVGWEARLVVVHGVLLARLVPYDIDQDVDRGLCVRGRWAISPMHLASARVCQCDGHPMSQLTVWERAARLHARLRRQARQARRRVLSCYTD